jgi:hypothetical protein
VGLLSEGHGRKMEPIVIHYQLTLAEFLEAQRIARRTRTFQYWFSRAMMMLVIFMIAIIVLFGRGHTLPGVAPGLGVIVLWIATIYWVPRYMATKQFRSSRGLQASTTVEFSSDGVQFRSEVTQSRTAWKAYMRCVESESLFLLFASNTSFHTFPKRAFAEPDVPRFRGLIEQNVRA